MIRLQPDFKEFLNLLNARQVEYLVIGGYAVGYYGYPRATADFNIWVAIHPKNAELVIQVLEEFGFPITDANKEQFLKVNQIFRMGVPPVRLEITTSISGVTFEECFKDRVIADLDGVRVNLISLEHLKLNKKASGRFKDLNDLEHLDKSDD